MKNLLFACAVLALSGGAAFANSNAYPDAVGSAGATLAAMPPSGVATFANADAYPDFSTGPTTNIVAGGVLPPLGGQGEPESANSLPSGFERGTAPYQTAQTVGRYLQAQADRLAHRMMADR